MAEEQNKAPSQTPPPGINYLLPDCFLSAPAHTFLAYLPGVKGKQTYLFLLQSRLSFKAPKPKTYICLYMYLYIFHYHSFGYNPTLIAENVEI